MAMRQTTASLPFRTSFHHLLSKMSSLFIYFLVATIAHLSPPLTTKSFAEAGLTNGTIAWNSNIINNGSTTLDSAVELVTQSSNVANGSDQKIISSVTLLVNDTHSQVVNPSEAESTESLVKVGEFILFNATEKVNDTHSEVINPSEAESTVGPVKVGEVLLINATEEVTSPSPATNEEGLQSPATVREPFVSSSTNAETLLTANQERELSNGSTINGEVHQSNDKEREPSHSQTNEEAPLATAREMEHSLSPSTNGDALLINDTSVLSEIISPIVESVRKENHLNNDFSDDNETKAFGDRPSTNDSFSSISLITMPSLTSQTEEDPAQVTTPTTKSYELKKRILASTEPIEKGIETEFKPTVLAKKCCGDSETLHGTNCVAKTNKSPFEPLIGHKNDSESNQYTFSWGTMMLTCPKNFKLREISLPGLDMSLGASKTQSYLEWKELLMIRQTAQYCIDQQQDGGYTALMCMADEEICNEATCIRKCCGHGEVISNNFCKPGSSNSSLAFYTLAGDVFDTPPDLQLVPLVPNCPFKVTMKFVDYHLLPNGKLYVMGRERIIDNDMFCVDYYKELNSNIVMHCITKPSAAQEWKLKIAPIGMLVSIACLVLLILFHFFAKKLLNVQGYCFLSYSTSLLLGYIGFLVNTQYAKQISYSHCVFNGLFSQFTLHAAFFWLSVMSFDIWRVIRSTVKCIPLTGILEKDMQKFLLYSAYAFGCPLIIVLVTLGMQSLSEESAAGMIVPGFGEESCWFADEKSQFLYFYLVIAALNAASLCMLGHVIFLLCQAEPGVSCILQKKKAPRAFNRKHLALFRQRLSIFAMMAICWFTEVLSLKIPPKDAWVITDILNTLQGVIVFIIFLVSKQKRQLVKEGVKKVLRRTLRKINSNVTEESDVADTPETSKDTTGSNEQSPREMAMLPAEIRPSGNNRSNPLLPERLGQESSLAHSRDNGVVNAGYQHDMEETKGVSGPDNMKERDSNV